MKKIITSLLLFLSLTISLQAAETGRGTLRQVFVLLSHGNYAQATARFIDFNHANPDPQALYPLPDLAQALILARPEGTGSSLIASDPWQAMTLVRNAQVREQGLEQANKFLADGNIRLSVDAIRNLVEKRLIAYTKQQDNAEAYERLMTVLSPTSPAYQEAKQRMARLEFDRMCTSASGCRAYLQDNPDSPLAKQAQDLAVKFDFEDAQRKGTAEGWQHFISTYRYAPNAASYLDRARKTHAQLQQAALVNSQVTLAELDKYASTVRRDPADKILVNYDNLVNLPMSSYRLRSNQLAFDGAVGTVTETVKGRVTAFVFNAQGLLAEQRTGKSAIRYSYGYDPRHGFYPANRVEKGKTYRYSCYYGAVGGRLSRVTCTDGTEWTFDYDPQGRLTAVTQQQGKVTRKSTYKSGKIRTLDSSDKQSIRFLRYDDSRVTQLDITRRGKLSTITIAYDLDPQSRWTQAVLTLNQKPQLTIHRSYAD